MKKMLAATFAQRYDKRRRAGRWLSGGRPRNNRADEQYVAIERRLRRAVSLTDLSPPIEHGRYSALRF